MERMAVAPGGAADEYAVPVLQCNGQAVHLRFQGVFHTCPQGLLHPLAEFRYLFPIEHVLEALQRHLVGIGLEPFQNPAPHPLGGGIRCNLLRMLGLQFFQTAVQHVVFVIAHGGGVQHVVAVPVFVENVPQMFDFLAVVHSVPFPVNSR